MIRDESVEELVWSVEEPVWRRPGASSLAGRLGMVREAFPISGGDGWLFTVGFLASSRGLRRFELVSAAATARQ